MKSLPVHTGKTKGFTIVELLIVIVIIAILAAIALVAYNGIQHRAYVTRVNDGGKKIARAIAAYQAANGRSPSYSITQTCLGRVEDYPATDNFLSGQCSRNYTEPYGTNGIVGTTMNELNTIATGLPGYTKPVVWMDSWAVYRGYRYQTGQNAGMQTATVFWLFSGTQTCGGGSAEAEVIDATQPTGPNTRCRIDLPPIPL